MKWLICQKSTAKHVKLLKELHPHDIPQMKWECISMDFVTRLSKVIGGYKLTKVAHLILANTSSIAAYIPSLCQGNYQTSWHPC